MREYLEENNIDYSHFRQTKVPQSKEQYEANPCLCKNCKKPLPWEKRNNIFCSYSCAAEFNNNVRDNKVLSCTILDKVSDEDLIKIINSSTTWKEILEKVGYSNSSNQGARNKVRERAQKLGMSLNIRKSPDKKDWS